ILRLSSIRHGTWNSGCLSELKGLFMPVKRKIGASWRESSSLEPTGRSKKERGTGQSLLLEFLNHVGECKEKRRPLDGETTGHEIDKGYDKRNHQKQVNQTAGHVEAPTEKPQNDKDGKNRPKHRYPLVR